MREVQPSLEAAEVLKRFTDAGGVLHFVFFDCSEETENVFTETTHREAVIAGMYVLRERFGAYTKITAVKPRITQESVWRFEVDSSKLSTLSGRRISKVEFFGDGIRERWAGSGFAYAFTDTPYGLWIKAPEVDRLFEDVCSTVLGSVTDDTIIFEWPTDWSSFFDAGHEWWGSFLWSLGQPAAGRIIVIAASTTD